ncbi:MAG: hypothetical protein JRH01_12450 [Deltaproteobacteria bacterium]|nr:hypothetical protein [Deltaproteobacteria bacterium]MBW2395328.1 hypothetical protein [Deltaproteobacteria bacterium]
MRSARETWDFVRERPALFAILGSGGIAGAALAVFFELGPTDLGLMGRILGGALAGTCFAGFGAGYRLLD